MHGTYILIYLISIYGLFNMQKGGQYTIWRQLQDLFRKTHSESGLYIGNKLTREHVYLTSYSRMRVDLAAQVRLYVCAACT